MSRIHDPLRKSEEADFRGIVQDSDIGSQSELLPRAGKAGVALLRSRVDSSSVNGNPPEFDRRKLIPLKCDDDSDSGWRAPGYARSLRRGGRAKLRTTEQAREQVTNLVDSVFLIPNSSAPRAVMFACVDRVNGSSELCLQTARVLAKRTAARVCVLDAHLLGAPPDSETHPEAADAANHPGPHNNGSGQADKGTIWLLPAGSFAGETLDRSSERMRRLLLELRDEFDYVLIEGPSITSAASMVSLGQMSDGVIIVIEANSTRREAALRAKGLLDSAHVRVLGAILNNRDTRLPGAL